MVTVEEPLDLRALLAKMKSADAGNGFMSVWDIDIKTVEDAIATIEAIRKLGVSLR